MQTIYKKNEINTNLMTNTLCAHNETTFFFTKYGKIS